MSKQEPAYTVNMAPGEQSGMSHSLSRLKKKLDMKDGDEHFVNDSSTVGPINDMYIAIRELSCFPFGGGRSCLIHNTQLNRR
jgi:hypothetical protein